MSSYVMNILRNTICTEASSNPPAMPHNTGTYSSHLNVNVTLDYAQNIEKTQFGGKKKIP